MNRHIFYNAFSIIIALLFFGCQNQTKDLAEKNQPLAVDTHSFSNPEEVMITNMDLDLKVNFEEKKISGKTSLELNNKTSATQLVLDTYDLTIHKITKDDGAETNFSLDKKEGFLGQPLNVDITPETKVVNIYYETSPDAPALQWLDKSQTTNGDKPYLFTQSQAILARSWIPCQDTPGVRMTYRALVKVRSDLIALMSAKNPIRKSPQGFYEFVMPQPIPSYLMALAVGEIDYRPMSPITGVYASPTIVDAAAYEFGNTQEMIEAAEKLYGPYQWGKYDILVLPPSFPFGGMENPRLTFATPTIIAGDRSLTSLIAHELAHSWSGNLVTNATWNDFWINEGFTTYIERRIMEELYGRAYEEMLAELGFQDLEQEIQELGENNPDTRLHLDLQGRDPDDGMTDVAYEKGALFLRMLEENVGREKWDAFLRRYFSEFEFQTMTSDRFVDYLTANLFDSNPQKVEELQIGQWIYGTGIPENCPKVESKEFDKVQMQIDNWLDGTAARMLETKDWTTHHWIYFLRNLPDSLSLRQMAELDVAFNLTQSRNSEILFAWLKLAIHNEYKRAYPALESFLMTVGRRKFLKPLYKELAKTPDGKRMALSIYGHSRNKYHSITYHTIDDILDWKNYLARLEKAKADSARDTTKSNVENFLPE